MEEGDGGKEAGDEDMEVRPCWLAAGLRFYLTQRIY